jgi:hypothetical protein
MACTVSPQIVEGDSDPDNGILSLKDIDSADYNALIKEINAYSYGGGVVAPFRAEEKTAGSN